MVSIEDGASRIVVGLHGVDPIKLRKRDGALVKAQFTSLLEPDFVPGLFRTPKVTAIEISLFSEYKLYLPLSSPHPPAGDKRINGQLQQAPN